MARLRIPDIETPRHHGHGFATEAAHAALNWAFESGATAVTCEIDLKNTRSLALAQRLDFVAAGPGEKDGTRRYALGREARIG